MDSVAAIVAAVRAEKARQAAEAADSQEPSVPPVTNTRRAADWESRHSDRVRKQTKSRVAAHRARNPDEYRAYMREYMKNKRAKQ